MPTSWMRPGISLGNLLAVLYGSLVSIALIVFVNIGQPYVLLENLGIPEEDTGKITGSLVMVAEVVTLLSIGYLGVLNDRIGRRPVMVWGTLLMGLSYAVFPLAGTVLFLFLVRAVLAVGTTAEANTITTIIHDYAAEHARGKMLAVMAVLMGIGAVLVNVVVGNLPARFVAMGQDTVTAGQWMHWIVAGICVFSALVFQLGLKGGTPVRREERLPQLELFKRGFASARQPRLALAYAAAFVSRSDMVVLGTFIVLWGTVAGRNAGMDTADAVSQGVKVFALTQTAGLLSAPLVGYMVDRMDRVTGLAVCAFVGAVGYLSMGFVDNPADPVVLPLLLLLGVGQTACNLGAQALVGNEAPEEIRGVVVHFFGFCGTVGIIASTWIGGVLFDAWAPSAPFVLVGGLTALVFLLGLRVRRMGTSARTAVPAPLPSGD
jgi:MFS family permease